MDRYDEIENFVIERESTIDAVVRAILDRIYGGNISEKDKETLLRSVTSSVVNTITNEIYDSE